MSKILLILFLLSPNINAYSFKHPNCKIRVPSQNDENKVVYPTYMEKLKEKGFQILPLIDNKKLFSGELYTQIIVERLPAKFWKDCVVQVFVKHAQSNRILSDDKIKFQKKIKMSFPRVTPSGGERCKKALKVAFTHIPYCSKGASSLDEVEE